MSSGSKDILYVVMPAYNEEDNIEHVVLDWIKVLKFGSKESRLVIADSGSKDMTHNILLGLKKKYNQLEILENTNQYHGPKVIALYKYAIKNGADYIFQTDSDGQTNPAEFEGFWKIRNEYDGILGVRRNRGDGKSRAFVEKIVCFLLRLFFGVKVPDANAPFRLMRGEMVNKYISKLPADYDIPNIILTTYFEKNGEKLLFRDVSFMPRVAGKNSINFKKIFSVGVKSLKDFLYFRKDMKKKDSKAEGDVFWKKIVIMIAFAVVAGILVVISPAFPWNGGMEMTDSSVFLTIGRQMKGGMTPYVDTFDHKGPLLYLINFFGVLINEVNGIFLFEFLAIFLTIWFMYKIFKLNNSGVWFSATMSLLLFTPFVFFYLSEGGNLTEQYAMPFIAFSLFVFLKNFHNGSISSSNFFWAGVSFMCVLMMRVNMAGVWPVFCLGIIVKSIVEKKFSDLWRMIKWFIVGMLCVATPIIIWLAANGALAALVDAYFVFNLSYSVGGNVDGIASTILYFMQDILILLSGFLAIVNTVVKKDNRYTTILYLIAFVLCTLTAGMSGRIYPHYGMVLVPLVVYPFSIFCSDLAKNDDNNALRIMLLMFLVSLTFTTWLNVSDRFMKTLHKEVSDVDTIEIVDDVCKVLDDYTDFSDKISVFGNWNYVYLRCNRFPVSKYSYQFPIGEIRPTILDEYFQEINAAKPKVLVINEKDMMAKNERILEFVESNGYAKVLEKKEGTIKAYVLER